MKRNKTFRIFQKKKMQKRFFEKDFYFKKDSEERRYRALKLGDNPKRHKCQCCCNKRRSNYCSSLEKLSLQERRDLERVLEIKKFEI